MFREETRWQQRPPGKARHTGQGNGAQSEHDDSTPVFTRRDAHAIARISELRILRGRDCALTIAEAARVLGITEARAEQLVRNGSLPSERLACGCRVVRVSTLAADFNRRRAAR